MTQITSIQNSPEACGARERVLSAPWKSFLEPSHGTPEVQFFSDKKDEWKAFVHLASVERPKFNVVLLWRNDSISNSLPHFVGQLYQILSECKAVYYQRIGERFFFYSVVTGDREEDLDKFFEVEKFLFSRFAGEEIDFDIFPEEDSKDCLPPDAIKLWSR